MSDDDFSDDDEIGNLLKKDYVEVDKPKNPLTHHFIDYNQLLTYIYPTNFEIRDYQFNIVKKAFYNNLLVTLPTGLGKTFIASTVILNFLRWFPDSKLIFMAPTKPLVAQQIKACCSITGISSSKVAILLDKSKNLRLKIWNDKSVFFTTPQVVENDLANGSCDPKKIVLLVIDEAHRAKGNYAYNNVCQFINRFNSSYRVLALTATPATNIEGVQEIINNLHISKIEVRTENSIDIIKYIKRKKIERITVHPNNHILHCIDLLSEAILPVLTTCNERKIYDITDPKKINAFQAMESSQRIIRNPTIPEGLKWSNYFLLQLLIVVGQCLRRLNIYGIKSFYTYFTEKHNEFITKYDNKKSTNHTAASFYKHEKITELLNLSESLINDNSFISHPKLEVLIENLKVFASENPSNDSKVIVFTEFRESALEIVQSIENLRSSLLKPHIFIGQAKEREKFDEVKFLNKGRKKPIAQPKAKTPSIRSSSEDAQLKGMNQKIQKKLIKDFKNNSYNILVATSIGEEGLDIGEVDLIVCYDSTSSPIKNIQRMGRTGRKRDGKVLLLFSSNEESKFNKAMEGYEYIQQHIMGNNLIDLFEQNRIIPKNYEPIVEKKFIEIPPENVELKLEDDEDEIIKIALNYMNNKQLKSNKKLKKQEKKFNMPDNVETGFTTVTNMIKRKGDSVSIAEKRKREQEWKEREALRERDLLDDLVDSDEEASQRVRSITSSDSKRQKTQSLEFENSINLDSDDDTPSKTILPNPSPNISSPQKRKSLGTRRPPLKIQKPITSLLEYKDDYPAQSNERKTVKTLGPKRRTVPSIIDQLKKQKDKTDEQLQQILSDFKQNPPSNNEDDNRSDDLDDEFNDGLDHELLSVAETYKKSTPSPSILAKSTVDSPYKNTFEHNEGFLNESDKFELYTSYFVNLKSSDKSSFLDPIDFAPSSNTDHSRISTKLIKCLHFINSLDPATAQKVVRLYTNGKPPSQESSSKALQHLVVPDSP